MNKESSEIKINVPNIIYRNNDIKRNFFYLIYHWTYATKDTLSWEWAIRGTYPRQNTVLIKSLYQDRFK